MSLPRYFTFTELENVQQKNFRQFYVIECAATIQTDTIVRVSWLVVVQNKNYLPEKSLILIMPKVFAEPKSGVCNFVTERETTWRAKFSPLQREFSVCVCTVYTYGDAELGYVNSYI